MNGTTPAIERAAEAIVREEGIIDWNVLGESLRDYPRGLARAGLAAALDADEMARALAPSVADYWCGDHIDEQYDALDEDTEELRCEDCKRARHEKAREAVGLVRAALLGSDQ